MKAEKRSTRQGQQRGKPSRPLLRRRAWIKSPSIAAAVKKIIATRTPFATDADKSRVFMAMMGDAFIKARVDNAEIANFRLGSQQRVGITKASPGQVLQCLVAVPVNEKGVHLTPVDMDGYGSGFCMICTGDLSPVHLAPYDERKADATRKL